MLVKPSIILLIFMGVFLKLENFDAFYDERGTNKQLYSATNEAFITWLKEQRVVKGLTVRDVGALKGRYFPIVTMIETQVRRMDVAEFYEYCQALDLDPEACFDYIPKCNK